LFSQSTADVLAGVPHVICLDVAGRAASIITEAEALQELRELPGFGFGQDDSDLDAVLLIHDAHVPSVSLDVAAAGIDLSFDAPGETTVMKQARQLQGAVELM
jgi:hypothetical protein